MYYVLWHCQRRYTKAYEPPCLMLTICKGTVIHRRDNISMRHRTTSWSTVRKVIKWYVLYIYTIIYRSYIWASCHISKASRIARMILVFFMYDPIKTETWLIFHLWFLQYSSIQPNGFYGIRMKKVSRHNKKKDVI